MVLQSLGKIANEAQGLGYHLIVNETTFVIDYILDNKKNLQENLERYYTFVNRDKVVFLPLVHYGGVDKSEFKRLESLIHNINSFRLPKRERTTIFDQLKSLFLGKNLGAEAISGGISEPLVGDVNALLVQWDSIVKIISGKEFDPNFFNENYVKKNLGNGDTVAYSRLERVAREFRYNGGMQVQKSFADLLSAAAYISIATGKPAYIAVNMVGLEDFFPLFFQQMQGLDIEKHGKIVKLFKDDGLPNRPRIQLYQFREANGSFERIQPYEKPTKAINPGKS